MYTLVMYVVMYTLVMYVVMYTLVLMAVTTEVLAAAPWLAHKHAAGAAFFCRFWWVSGLVWMGGCQL